MTEKTHHFECIIGGKEADKQSASSLLQEIFDSRNSSLEEYELKKTPEDLEVIKTIEPLVDKMVLNYGGKIKATPIDHIYILKLGSISKMTKGRLNGVIYRIMGSKIGIEKEKSKLMFVGVIAYELLHSKSYKSARIGKSADDVRLYRNGIEMYDMKNPDSKHSEEKNYFGGLEEAIVAECTRKILDELRKEEVEAIDKLLSWVVKYFQKKGLSEEKSAELVAEFKYIPDAQNYVKKVLAFSDDEKKRQAYAAGMFESIYKSDRVKLTERYYERMNMYKVLDRLVADSGGKFKERDEIFDEFAKANFTGNYLSLARIIEGILGKGSFRKLAEEFSND